MGAMVPLGPEMDGVGSGGGWVPEPTRAIDAASMIKVPFENPSTVGANVILIVTALLGAIVRGKPERPEIEYGLFVWPTPIFEMIAASVPEFLI